MSANCCLVPKPPCSDSALPGTMIMKRMSVSSCCRCGSGARLTPTSNGLRGSRHGWSCRLASQLQTCRGGRLDPVAEGDAVADGLRHTLEDRHETVVVDVAGHLVGHRLDLVRGVAHGDAPGRPVQHLEVVALVAAGDGVGRLH